MEQEGQPQAQQFVAPAFSPRPQQMMDFMDALTTVFRTKYATFSGRASRSEYWWFVLFLFIGEVVLGTIDIFLGTGALQTLFNLVTLIPGLALGARRLHDIGRSGWWQLLWFVILVGWIILIIWTIRQGQQGQNKHGLDPRSGPA